MDSKTEPRIAAVVATFNRLGELQGCVAALRAQTRPLDAVVVVASSSDDKTRVWLKTQKDLHLLEQENQGSGAAFARGMREAVARGFDWVWCLDDDAHPTATALAELCRAMRARPDARVLNSISAARNDPTRFAIGALCVRNANGNYLAGQNVDTRAALEPHTDANGMVDSAGGHFYHGILIHRSVVETTGVPSAAFFFYGDEVEYGLRLMDAGHHIRMVTTSLVKHPALPSITVRFGKRTKTFHLLNRTRCYYAIRNGIWIHRMYYGGHSLPYALRRLAGAWLADLIAPNRSMRDRAGVAVAALRGTLDGLRVAAPDKMQG